MILLGERRLLCAVDEFVAHYHGERTHQGLGNELISPARAADAGGSNGPRLHAWKVHLQGLADDLGLPITVCHYPPGTSKWNQIEHRLFSFISLNWRGQPLVSFEAIVNLIGRTRTKTGLKVKAVLDTRAYETGAAVTPQQIQALRLRRHAFHPEWNYTLSPHPTS